MRDALLVVGNGLAMDLRSYAGPNLAAWDTREPLRWDLTHPLLDVGLRDLFPRAFAALSAAAVVTDFDRMQTVLQKKNVGGIVHEEVELRHYLVMAYSMYQLAVDALDVSSWQWSAFFARIAPRVSCLFSLNYDTTAENLLRAAGQRPHWPGIELSDWERRVEPWRPRPTVAVVKPHGSINFRASEWIMDPETVTYPIHVWFSDNDMPFNRCYRPHWLKPRVAADVVIPTEDSRFRRFQWIQPGFEWLRSHVPQASECYIIGVSYAACDRADIDQVLDALVPGVRVVVADPYPSAALIEKLEGEGHAVEVWTEGPPSAAMR